MDQTHTSKLQPLPLVVLEEEEGSKTIRGVFEESWLTMANAVPRVVFLLSLLSQQLRITPKKISPKRTMLPNRDKRIRIRIAPCSVLLVTIAFFVLRQLSLLTLSARHLSEMEQLQELPMEAKPTKTLVLTKTMGRDGPVISYRSEYQFSADDLEQIDGMLGRQSLSRKCFVCITGQMERLELEDKVLHLLNPLRLAGLIPEVALVLTDAGVPRFTNDGFVGGQIYPSYAHASEYLKSMGYTVLSTSAFKQSEDPPVSELYTNKMGNTSFNFLPEQKKTRAQNHYRQYESLRQCGVLYQAAQTNYSFVLRARDDLGFRLPLWNATTTNLTLVLADLYRTPRTILSTDCRTYDGINDRFAWVSPGAARDYFTTPLASMTSNLVPKETRNPETFLMHSYLNRNITVILSARLRGLLKLQILANNITKPANDREWKGMFCPEDYRGGYALTYRDPTKQNPPTGGKRRKAPPIMHGKWRKSWLNIHSLLQHNATVTDATQPIARPVLQYVPHHATKRRKGNHHKKRMKKERIAHKSLQNASHT